jgi:hypothetical protein
MHFGLDETSLLRCAPSTRFTVQSVGVMLLLLGICITLL